MVSEEVREKPELRIEHGACNACVKQVDLDALFETYSSDVLGGESGLMRFFL